KEEKRKTAAAASRNIRSMNLKVAISPFRQRWVKVAARLSSSEKSSSFTVKPKTAGKHLFRSEYLLHSNLFLAKTSRTRRGTYSQKETTIPTQQLQALRWPTSSTHGMSFLPF
ncbi:hypothetical protein TcG_04929, partial [Trypanosoma cruzi]